MVREKVVDLIIEHISSKHTTPQKLTLQAGRKAKGDSKNDMEFFLFICSDFDAVLRVALYAQGLRGIAQAIRTNLPAALA